MDATVEKREVGQAAPFQIMSGESLVIHGASSTSDPVSTRPSPFVPTGPHVWAGLPRVSLPNGRTGVCGLARKMSGTGTRSSSTLESSRRRTRRYQHAQTARVNAHGKRGVELNGLAVHTGVDVRRPRSHLEGRSSELERGTESRVKVIELLAGSRGPQASREGSDGKDAKLPGVQARALSEIERRLEHVSVVRCHDEERTVDLGSIRCIELEIERLGGTAEELGQQSRRGAELGGSVTGLAHQLGIDAKRDIVEKETAIDRPVIDSTLHGVPKGPNVLARVSPIESEVEGEMVPGARGDANKGNIEFDGHCGHCRLGAVPACHAEAVGPPGDGITGSALKVEPRFEDDRIHTERGRELDQAKAFHLAATGERVAYENWVDRRPHHNSIRPWELGH